MKQPEVFTAHQNGCNRKESCFTGLGNGTLGPGATPPFQHFDAPDDFRRIQIGAPRDQEAERNEAVVSVMNDLETTSLADYYLKKFTDQGNLLLGHQ